MASSLRRTLQLKGATQRLPGFVLQLATPKKLPVAVDKNHTCRCNKSCPNPAPKDSFD